MRRTLMLITLAALAAPPPVAAQQVEVTLPEAIRRALEVQPAMVQAEGTRHNAGAARRTALGAFLPSVSAGGAVTKNSRQRIDQNSQQLIPPIPNYATSLSANVDLFTGFRRLADLRSSSANVDAATAGVVAQRFDVRLQTKQAFYSALAAEELVRITEAQVKRAEQQLRVSIDKLRAGSATRSDSLRSTVDFGNARIALLQARATLETAQANLGRQIGVAQLVRALRDSVLPPLPDTAALRRSTLESTPQVQQADAQARAARAGVWSARSQYMPMLNLSLGTNRRDTLLRGALTNNDVDNWRVGLSWTLFNGFSREQQQVAAGVARDVAQARAAETRRQVNASLTQQLAALATSYQQIDIARANVAAATEDLRVLQERYRVGVATILDLLTSQTSLTQAEVGLLQTRFNYLIARAEVEALVGREL